MYISKIKITYTNMGLKTYEFSSSSNLITSNGYNTRGKTSLIRFIIWGMGFNVALTNQFKKTAYAETNIELKNSEYETISRKGNQIILYSKSGESKYDLPDDESSVLNSIFPNTPNKEVLKQLLGFIYFDQDGGYRAWNRNVVTQRFSNDRSYKISIESLIANLEDINYKEYLSTHNSLQKARNQTINFTQLISTIDQDDSYLNSNNTSISDDITDLNDKISIKKLELNRIINKKSIYTSNLKDQTNFKKLLKKLSIKVKVDGNIINVTDDNIIQDKHLNTRLIEFEKHYSYLEKRANEDLKKLIVQRDILMSAKNPNKDITLFDDYNSFKQLQKLISKSGIIYEDGYSAAQDLSTAYRNNEALFHKKLKDGNSYTKIWNSIVSLAKDVGLESKINTKRNGLLDKKINESGARRSLIVMIYRLGILKYLNQEYNLLPPLILDSPASSEMDEENLNELISMILKEFSDFQIIVATNQKNNIKFSKTLLINNGVLNTII